MTKYNFLLKRSSVQVFIFLLFISCLLTMMGYVDAKIEPYIEYSQFTGTLIKIIGIYGVHLAIIIACFYNNKASTRSANMREGNVMSGHERVVACIVIILCICWNFMIFITLKNYNDHLTTASIDSGTHVNIDPMSYEEFIHRLDCVSSAINFLVAGGLVYFFGKKN